MHLNKEQIELLHQFCKKHGVQYYDVRLEIVDHLAHAIEIKIASESHLTFEQALQNVYASFGVTGFRKIIAEKERYTEQKTNKIFHNYMKSFFKLPHIMLTILLAVFFSLSYMLFKDDFNVLTSIISIVIWILFIAEILLIILATIRNKKLKQNLLMTRFFLPGYFFLAFSSSFIWTKPMSYLIWRDEFLISNTAQYIFYSAIITVTILCTIAIIQSNQYLHQQARKQFPQAFS